MNLKPPKNANPTLHYVVRFLPCYSCARQDVISHNLEQGIGFNKECTNCEGEGYRAVFIPLTRQLVETIIYEESEK